MAASQDPRILTRRHWEAGLWAGLRLWGWSLRQRDLCSYESDPRELPRPCHHVTAQGEDAICEPGVGLSPEPRYEVTLILDVQPAELHWEKDVSVIYKPTGLW